VDEVIEQIDQPLDLFPLSQPFEAVNIDEVRLQRFAQGAAIELLFGIKCQKIRAC